MVQPELGHPGFVTVATAPVVDACLRRNVVPRISPAAVTAPVFPGALVVGPVVPVVHRGSVDVFLRAIDSARPGDVLVIDNGGRGDEACVGDLVVLEAKEAGIAAIVIWGLHRDTTQLRELALPLWTMGAHAAGPNRAVGSPQMSDSIDFLDFTVGRNDIVVADDDGVVFVSGDQFDEVISEAQRIASTEVRQASAMRAGTTLREQVGFSDYLAHLQKDPNLTFRQHLRARAAEIEE